MKALRLNEKTKINMNCIKQQNNRPFYDPVSNVGSGLKVKGSQLAEKLFTLIATMLK